MDSPLAEGATIREYRLIEQFEADGARPWRGVSPEGSEVRLDLDAVTFPADAPRDLLVGLVRLLACRHPGVKSPIESWWEPGDGSHPGRLVTVTESVTATLADCLRERQAQGLRGVPAVEVSGYLRTLAGALDWLHERGVVHGAVMTGRIAWDGRRARLDLVDLVRSQYPDPRSFGNPHLIAPELLEGRPAIARSDQYGLAASLAWLRLGHPPFPTGGPMALMQGHLRGPKIDSLPQAERAVFAKAFSRDPARRYESCRELARQFARAVSPEGDGALRYAGRLMPAVR